MITLFFLKLASGIILGLGTGIVLGSNNGDGALLSIILYSFIGIGWWIGIIFLMKRGFGQFFSIFFSGFINMFSFVGTENTLSIIAGLANALCQMVTAIFRSAIMGWKELINEVKGMKAINNVLKGQGIEICRNYSELQTALSRKVSSICIESGKKLDTLLEEVYNYSPWLYDCVKFNHINKIKNNTILPKEIYKVNYVHGLVSSSREVINADSTWSLGEWFTSTTISKLPLVLQILTKDPKGVEDIIEKEKLALPSALPGMTCFRLETLSPHPKKQWTNMFLRFDYGFDESTLSNLEAQSEGKIHKIIDEEFGGEATLIPNLIKIFLVYSFIQQECQYDVNLEFEYWDKFLTMTPQTNPIIASCYNVLLNRKGLSPGYAVTFKKFMDFYHIENKLIYGARDLSSSSRSGNYPHVWNLIKISDRWCHVDSSFGQEISSGDVDIRGFMRTDKQMLSQSYQWEQEKFPTCNTSNYSYNRVEDLIEDHGAEYCSAGVNSQYLSP